MSVLVLTSRPIRSARSGYDLRVANLCGQLPGDRHLMILPLGGFEDGPSTIDAGSIFESVEQTAPLLDGPMRLRRHLRLSDAHFLQRARPAAFAAATDRVTSAIRRHGVTKLIVFGGDLAEFVSSIRDCELYLDVCDSRTLTARREMALGQAGSTQVGRVRDRVSLRRLQVTESRLPDRFDAVVAVSDPDRQEILDLHGSATNVHTIPNGVAHDLLLPLGEPGRRRGVAFWGNLSFAPNVEALRYFLHEVHLPFLRAHDVELCVVGAAAPAWLADVAAREPLVTVTGFVPGLAGAVGPYPVMVNPMRSGSGLKNKVLEAFGLGLAVVSTPLGVEAIPEARDGRHLALGTNPAELARVVLDLLDDDTRRSRMRREAHALVNEFYRWDIVGHRWRAVLGLDRPDLHEADIAGGRRQP